FLEAFCISPCQDHIGTLEASSPGGFQTDSGAAADDDNGLAQQGRGSTLELTRDVCADCCHGSSRQRGLPDFYSTTSTRGLPVSTRLAVEMIFQRALDDLDSGREGQGNAFPVHLLN